MHRDNFYASGVVINDEYLVLGLPESSIKAMTHYVEWCATNKSTKTEFKETMLNDFLKYLVVPLFHRDVRTKPLFLNQVFTFDYVSLYKDAKITNRLTKDELDLVLTKTALTYSEEIPKYYDTIEELNRAYELFVLYQKKAKQLFTLFDKITVETIGKELPSINLQHQKMLPNKIFLGVGKTNTIHIYVYRNKEVFCIERNHSYIDLQRTYSYPAVLYDTGLYLWF